MDKLQLVEKEPLTNQEKEVYRTLRTNIEFTGVENRVLAITSAPVNHFYDNLMHKKRLDEENKHFEKWVYG